MGLIVRVMNKYIIKGMVNIIIIMVILVISKLKIEGAIKDRGKQIDITK